MLVELARNAEKNARLYRRLDILSAFFVVLVFIIFPVWWHYDPENGKMIDGRMSLHTKVVLVFLLPALGSGVWLGLRYATALAPKHAFMRTQKFRLFVTFGMPAIILIIIGIIDSLWS